MSSEYQLSSQPPHFPSGVGMRAVSARVICDETSPVQLLLWFKHKHGYGGVKEQQTYSSLPFPWRMQDKDSAHINSARHFSWRLIFHQLDLCVL